MRSKRFWGRCSHSRVATDSEILFKSCALLSAQRGEYTARYGRPWGDAPEIEDRREAEVVDLARRDRKVPRGRHWRRVEGCPL